MAAIRFEGVTRRHAVFDPANAPHVTVIRPIKGLEPRLYDCLASTFRQDYPNDKLHIRFCVSDRSDHSVPIVRQLLADFPNHDAELLLEEDDEVLKANSDHLGPNPKIRNMSRAYREATGDVIWIIDCNVWVAKGVCGRMVAKLEGRGETRRNKFVHLTPLTLDISHERTAWTVGGGRLEEAFMASAHAKFYTAINTVLFAPCIVGKSTMFRRSHLDSLTHNEGIDYFSENICEDHLIGDLLWKQKVPEESQGEKLGKHACCFGDFAIQPMANMSVGEFWSRRVRWLRVRKFTVTLATLVEPGTECFLCSLYGAFAVTTLPFFHDTLAVPQTWTAFFLFWLTSVTIWCAMDRTLYLKLHSGASIEVDKDTPFFATPPKASSQRTFGEWLFAWLGRETLTLPIWLWAFYGGTKVAWRGKKFRVGMDMKVHEITSGKEAMVTNHTNGKARKD
ncbi:glycosyltransferase family 21 protein [Pseudocercospora fijiensis CIRAD86]|uniref:Ceramide glucosyltransferase n=1 Tax=Pseudocercospora fijiensis (strain CIRAD86) TaxID=383855 RepID=M3AVX3_PSEFD|nr:glycosyltransferase family 21 protein [Pseudocercospora fijiensis CIRAD86]EME81622.1 glycosyltransferase family 21 protein [Pseudocercospora fijiensis CIRAD86]